MREPSIKSKRHSHSLWFVIPGSLMIVVGFGLMLSCSLGGRLDAATSIRLPIGFTTAAVGGLVLSRTLLGTFFLFAYALTALILTIREGGLTDPWIIPFLLLLTLCLPMAKRARR